MKAIAPEITDNGKLLVLYTDGATINTNTYDHEIMIYYDMAFILSNMMTEENKSLLTNIDNMLTAIIPKRKVNRKKVFFDEFYR